MFKLKEIKKTKEVFLITEVDEARERNSKLTISFKWLRTKIDDLNLLILTKPTKHLKLKAYCIDELVKTS